MACKGSCAPSKSAPKGSAGPLKTAASKDHSLYSRCSPTKVAVSTKRINKPFTCRLPDDSSIYTAELRAILLALKHVYYSKEKSFFILSDSLSSLQSILNLKYDHPVLVPILELYTEMKRVGRKIVFIWVPGHVGIRGNSAADSAAKDALDGDTSVELIPFSDLKSRTNNYILELSSLSSLSRMSSRKINYIRYSQY